jgi:hypothetical protein
VVVAVDADRRARFAEVDQPVEDGVGGRTVHIARLKDVELGGDPLGPRLGVRRLPAERVGQGHVHAPGHGAEAGGLTREVAAGLGRVGRRRRGVGADDGDRRRVVHAEQVAQRGERQRPSLGRSGQERLEDGHVVVAHPPGGQGRGDRGEPLGGQGLGHLDLGVVPGLDPPEQLEDDPLVVDQRAVRLLGAHHPRPLGVLVGSHPVEDDHGQLGVVHRVVGDGIALVGAHVGDEGLIVAAQELGVLVPPPHADHDLVHRTVGVDQQASEHGEPVAPDLLVDDLDRRRRRLAVVPPLPRQPLRQRREPPGHIHHGFP